MADVKILYFAWIREKIGRGEETIILPDHVASVSQLIQLLCEKGPEYEAALSDPSTIRIALNQQHVEQNASLVGAQEVAFFPPVTGG